MSTIAVQSGSLAAGIHRLADPKISLASMASIFLGTCAAAREGALDPLWLAITVFGIFGIEVAKNASGEIFDFDSGTDLAVEDEDRSPFSGGKRVLVDGLLSRRQTWAVAGAGYAVGLASGVLIVTVREPRVLWLGLVGMACAYFYHAPPLKLSYRGLGELAVAFCYGPMIAAGTYLVQRGTVQGPVLPVSVLLGILIAAFLWINQLPDYRADVGAGKMNLVARMGRRTAARVFPLLIAAPLLVLALMPMAGYPAGILAGLAAVATGVPAARLTWRFADDTPRLVRAQAMTLLTFLLFAVGSGVGLLL